MTNFNDENRAERMMFDALCGGVAVNMVAEEPACYGKKTTSWKDR